MFLGTLGYNHKNDKVLSVLPKKRIFNDNSSEQQQELLQKRRRLINEDIVKQHIESFKPAIHHYRREHAPHRRYLVDELNCTKLHKDFTEQYPEEVCSYASYNKILKSMNIAFTKLGNEECEKCQTFTLHEHGKENLQPDCESCLIFEAHHERYTLARKAYEEDKSMGAAGLTTFKVCSADMMKVVMLPMMEQFKAAIFEPKLATYTQTFTPLGRTCSPDDPPKYLFGMMHFW
jgi:hypothetical protein